MNMEFRIKFKIPENVPVSTKIALNCSYLLLSYEYNHNIITIVALFVITG